MPCLPPFLQYFFVFKMNSFQNINRKGREFTHHRIFFTIKKNIKYGQAVYVCGSAPELGFWNPKNSLRLQWNENDTWIGEIAIDSRTIKEVQFKYVIADWSHPKEGAVEWQIGQHNRVVDLHPENPLIICDNKWNIDKICLYMLAKKRKQEAPCQYYVTGNLPELGSWQGRKAMRNKTEKFPYDDSTLQSKENTKLNSQTDYQIWTYSFQVFRLQQQFYYSYMRKTHLFQSERKPGRIFKFNHQNACYPCRKNVIHPRGHIVIIDESSINELKFSQITSDIFVGSYPKTERDLEILKSQNINTILSIQSHKDYQKHGISPYYFKTLCREKGIKYKRCSIQDMNAPDFIQNAVGGIEIMEEALQSGGNIYVHCSAGIYRSPQMIALYLIAIKKYKMEEAVQLLKQKHSYAKPSSVVIEQALNLFEGTQIKRKVVA